MWETRRCQAFSEVAEATPFAAAQGIGGRGDGVLAQTENLTPRTGGRA